MVVAAGVGAQGSGRVNGLGRGWSVTPPFPRPASPQRVGGPRWLSEGPGGSVLGWAWKPSPRPSPRDAPGSPGGGSRWAVQGRRVRSAGATLVI